MTSIVDDGITVTSAQSIGATGSAHVTPIAPPHGVASPRRRQTDGARVGSSATYTVHITNLGFNDDTYTLGVGRRDVHRRPCSTRRAPTPQASISIASGETADVCVKVAVPGGAAECRDRHPT